jgi:peptidoglycan hydrolase-like protein with peptidoglycan-binding domain
MTRKGTKKIQTGLNDLGFESGTPDGIYGPITAAALRAYIDNDGQPMAASSLAIAQYQNSGLKRIVLHWSAGTHTVGGVDREHYHYIVDGSGRVHEGDHEPEDNISASDGDYAAHTRGTNTGSIGVSVAAMHGARERPFDAGPYPITKKQLASFIDLVARLAKAYGIPVTRSTILTHAEVERTLGRVQNGKWDITWIPGMTRVGDPIAVGDQLRDRIRAKM